VYRTNFSVHFVTSVLRIFPFSYLSLKHLIFPYSPFSLHVSFLGTFATARNAIISYVVAVCLSAWNNSASSGRIFVGFDIWVFFENLSKKFKCHSYLARIADAYMKNSTHFWTFLVQFFLGRERLQTKVVKKIRTHIIFNNFFENLAVYEIMCKIIVKPDRPRMAVWRMRFTCWMTKAKNTHT
jgi:hypothetical protein